MSETTKAGRRWRSTEATKQAVLDAASEVFSSIGYTDARIGDIVERSSVSVGSIYHHFGGKAEIFEVLWKRYVERMWQGAREGTETARHAGETDPVELVIAGSRAYLAVLSDPAMAAFSRAVMSSDIPPEFVSRIRQESEKWIRKNLFVFGSDDGVGAQLRAGVIVALLGEVEALYTQTQDPGTREALVEESSQMLRRLLAP